MRVFKDKTGREWKIEINSGEIIRIRAESNGRFDFYDPGKNDLATTLAADLPTCWEALWYVCSTAAKAAGVTAADFGRDLADDCLLEAQRLLLEEWRDFFHRLHRQELALVVEKANQYQQKKLELVKATLADPLLTTLDSRVEAKMSQELKTSFGKLEESLDKTLGPSPSPNSPE